MRVVILNTDYDDFLGALYGAAPGLREASYAEQMAARNASLFGVADFYSQGLRENGVEAWEIHVNNEYLQAAWGRENGIEVTASQVETPGWYQGIQRLRRRVSHTALRHVKEVVRPFLRKLDSRNSWTLDIALAQIRALRPDVILNQSIDGLPSAWVASLKAECRLLVGQIAAPIPAHVEYGFYDLLVSSLPNFVQRFQAEGLQAEYSALAFDPRAAQAVGVRARDIPLSFIGSMGAHHADRVKLLEGLCARFPMQVWGQGVETLPAASAIHACHRGSAWGKDMLSLIGRSALTLNHHIGISGDYANNMRMFEATGMGAALLTDAKCNLSDFFEPGREILVYDSHAHCLELVEHYSTRPEELEAIGAAAQARVLRDHTYAIRMGQLLGHLRSRL